MIGRLEIRFVDGEVLRLNTDETWRCETNNPNDWSSLAFDDTAWTNALVLAAGVPPAWLDGKGISLKRLRTPYGPLSYSLRKENGHVLFHIDRGTRLPAGGIVFLWPEAGLPGATRVNGKPAAWRNGELPITELPADVVVDIGPSRARTR